jgi:hypothetical protein
MNPSHYQFIQGRSQVRHSILTFNQPEFFDQDNHLSLFRQPISDKIKYAIWQLESAPTTGHLHIQGYIEFNQPLRISQIKSLFPAGIEVDIRSRQGSGHDRRWAIAYCSPSKHTDKTEADISYVAGPWEYNPHNIPVDKKKPATKSDRPEVYDQIVETIMAGCSNFDLIMKFPGQYDRCKKLIADAKAEKRRRDNEVSVFPFDLHTIRLFLYGLPS